MDKVHVYKCEKGCHIRIYPLWAGDEGEPCPRCGEYLMYRGAKTKEQIEQMQRDAKAYLLKSKKNLKKRKRRKV